MSVLLGLVAQSRFDGYGNHMGGGWTWLVIVAMIAMMGGMGWMMWSMMRGSGGSASAPPESPVDLLKSRYARGEMTTEEFQERLQTIEGAGR